jgi:hypothetical protein
MHGVSNDIKTRLEGGFGAASDFWSFAYRWTFQLHNVRIILIQTRTSMQVPPKPKSALGWHRILSPSAGVRVSPLCLGAMNFGDAWKSFMGECSKETAFEVLDYFYQNGGNFLDTSNNYQNGESEEWIGEWMEKRGVREQMVVATKV